MNRFLAFVLFGLLASPLGAQNTARSTEYGLQPGDQVETTFYTAGGEALASVAGTRLVDREGNVFFPFIGTVHVQGSDAQVIREQLVQRFGPYYKDPVITVTVKLKVNITGIVGAPSHYLLDPTTTIVDAIAQAGGTGLEFQVANNAPADLEHVRLVREGQTIMMNLRPETADPRPLEMRVQSGDWIYVPPRPRSRFRDDISFYAGLLSLFTSAAAAYAILSR